jgi:O-antigen/teichoic acid export membrane protein
MAYKDLVKDAALIGFTQIMVNLANFLLLPVITKILGTEDYGLWIQVLITVSLLSSVAMQGQAMTILRFLKVKDGKKALSVQFFTGLSFVVFVGFMLSAVLIAFSGPLASALFSNQAYAPLIVFAAIQIPFISFNGVSNSYFRAVGRIRTYAALNIINAFGGLGIILVFILGGYGVIGAVIGVTLMEIAIFLLRLALVINQIGISMPNKAILKRDLRFGMPLTPNSLIRWITSSSDRYIVNIILGIGMVGIYSAAYNIGAVIFLLVSPIQLILYPTLARYFDEDRLDKVQEYMRRSFRYYLMFTFPAVVGISILSTSILTTLTTPEFVSGAMVIPLIAIAGMFSGMLKFMENVLHLVKKTHLNLITLSIPAVVNVTMVVVLTPLMGIIGTALATTVAYALMFIIGTLIARNFLHFSIDMTFIIKSAAASILMAVVILLLPSSGMINLAFSIIIGALVYFGTLFLLKGFLGEEMAYLKLFMIKLKKGRWNVNAPPPGKEGGKQ